MTVSAAGDVTALEVLDRSDALSWPERVMHHTCRAVHHVASQGELPTEVLRMSSWSLNTADPECAHQTRCVTAHEVRGLREKGRLP